MIAEEIIKKAAMDVFLRSGFNGARMQEIANLAGVNKAMLHYYFSTKEQLFDTVFSEVMLNLQPELDAILESEQSFIEKLKSFITISFQQHQKNPKIIAFVFNELAKNPDRMQAHLKSLDHFRKYIEYFISLYYKDFNEGKLNEYSPLHLVIIIQGMIEYYHLSKSFLNNFICREGITIDQQFEEQLLEQILIFVENSLTKKNQ
ncbi:MAG TPA: TetR/AcrR family transcriptional regulator [Saprospiraceae bacterium]|nr:TetR/AcrR family transcriptional regulator [Saprospiraceae bacterium]